MATDRDLNGTGLSATRNYIPLIARILLSLLFIWSGVNKLLNPDATQQYMASMGMPLTGLFLVLAIITEIGGGVLLLLGYQAQWAALALVGFTVLATVIFHRNLAERMQQIQFFKNLAIIGGLLMVFEYGPGNLVLRLGQRRD